MHRRLIPYLILIFCLAGYASGQELTIGLQSNRLLKDNPAGQAKGLADDPVELPFFDDFTGSSYLPSPLLWTDNFAFINNSYSDRQITIGIATLDALDETGKLYERATPDGFEADHLTSRPINLMYPASDNIRLSFWYEAGGLGDAPESADSLSLQFFAPDEAEWYSVWRSDASRKTGFSPVIIRIEDPKYLKNGFQFRFVNRASLSDFQDNSMIGNCDHWNIDYVLLDRNRSETDTALADVAFRKPLRSILKTHEAMPWKQFRQVYMQEMGAFIPVSYRNNDVITRNVTRNFEIRDVYSNTIVHSFSAGATNIEPYASVDYNASLIYTFNTSNADSALFRISCHLITDDFDPKTNDTLRYDQVFSNYFAFDDGTAESGYGINGEGSRNAMVAYRFKSFMDDTLRAISICFNDSYLNSNARAFDLMVWDDNNGLPGNVIYSFSNVLVEPGDDINGFHTYILPDGVPVNDVFYVGWKQRSETFLNAGFDVNTLHRGRQFYWLNGIWYLSQKNGSLMIRPIVGKPVRTTSSDDENIPQHQERNRMWPNPAGDFINIECEGLLPGPSAFISISDLHGREMIRTEYSERIDISQLKPGIYTVVALKGKKRLAWFTLVVTK